MYRSAVGRLLCRPPVRRASDRHRRTRCKPLEGRKRRRRRREKAVEMKEKEKKDLKEQRPFGDLKE